MVICQKRKIPTEPIFFSFSYFWCPFGINMQMNNTQNMVDGCCICTPFIRTFCMINMHLLQSIPLSKYAYWSRTSEMHPRHTPNQNETKMSFGDLSFCFTIVRFFFNDVIVFAATLTLHFFCSVCFIDLLHRCSCFAYYWWLFLVSSAWHTCSNHSII